jgi:hypothetical protein
MARPCAANAAGALTASGFLTVVQDLLSFAVETWRTDKYRAVRTIDQQAGHMGFYAARLFQHEPACELKVRPDDGQPIQLRHMADPATRRATLWLVLQTHLVYTHRPAAPRTSTATCATSPVLWLQASFGLAVVDATSQRLAASISAASLAWFCRCR